MLAAAMDAHDQPEHRSRSWRRVTLVVIACLVAPLVLWWCVTLFKSSNSGTTQLGEPPPTWKPPPALTIWPENTADPHSPTYQVSQSKVDVGKSQWRLDPVRTATAFTHAVFGDVRVMYRGAPLTGPPGVRAIWLRLSCACGQPERKIAVYVTQPGRKGGKGIWSVMAVTSSTLGIPTPFGNLKGDDFLAGLGPFPITIDQTPSEHTAVGISSYDGCRTDYQGAVDLRGKQTFQLDLQGGAGLGPSVGPDGQTCTTTRAAYIFAYTTPQLTTQVGDPLKESAAISTASIFPFYWDPSTVTKP
jgi:hypothetical protein